MRSTHFAGAAVLAAAVLSASPPAAAALSVPAAAAISDGAPPGPSVETEPSTVAPGGTLRLRATGCESRTGTASSPAFGSIRLEPGDLKAGHLFGIATVHLHARTGAQQVSVRCGGPEGRSAATRVTVSREAAEAGAGGFGGTATAATATGGALLLAAAALGLRLRRRARTAPGR
ncbi:hypothetical protein KBZ10_10655 [Streptomyces sp. F63]|uniref:hypothetical protein n=1 Tax=Streptomyces sp. F63 TaxID=2824887 RepID=UPI001B399763|nr:hypothetical protein [Streptomyces sp. F63]MBQ0984970.1 hypothetical protein [Streptomyces sp. F63]